MQQHLYVGNNHESGTLRRYALPISSSSTPDLEFPAPFVVSLALDDAGNLAAGLRGGPIVYYPAPLSAASVPTATFNNRHVNGDAGTSVGQLSFLSTPAGPLLYAASTKDSINVFSPPFSDATVATASIGVPGSPELFGVTFDAAGNMYLANVYPATISVYAPPYTGSPVTTPPVEDAMFRKIAVNSTHLFAASVQDPGSVVVFTLPITASSQPAFTMTNGIGLPEAFAFDAEGNLYVANLTDATITVYAPPFSAASVPTTTLSMKPDGGPFSLFGIAIAP